jgi:hypothetical protein
VYDLTFIRRGISNAVLAVQERIAEYIAVLPQDLGLTDQPGPWPEEDLPHVTRMLAAILGFDPEEIKQLTPSGSDTISTGPSPIYPGIAVWAQMGKEDLEDKRVLVIGPASLA